MLSKLSQRVKAAGSARWLVAGSVALMIVTTLGVVGSAFLGWGYGVRPANLAASNTVIGVCAFVLVAATLIVALRAYLAATGRPDLEVRVIFRFCDVNEPVLEAVPWHYPGRDDDSVRRIKIEPPAEQQGECFVYVVNRSQYSARNPGVRIKVEGFFELSGQHGWTAVDEVGNLNLGPLVFQWDGGADHVIHGRWGRLLPIFYLGNAFTDFAFPPALVVTVVADGVMPKTHRLPVTVLDTNDYAAWSAERVARLVAQSQAAEQREGVSSSKH